MSPPASERLPRPSSHLATPSYLSETPTLGLPSASAEIPPGGEPLISRGACLGRYVVLYALGAGGMGKVYAAYDPELDRKVALKVLRGDLRRSHGAEAEQRLLREARAIARLPHPNVVTVHDVGEVDGRIFIAMELIAGITVESWLAEKPRSTRDVSRIFVEAGRGLAAAHAYGLIHRDFKPRNVMVARDGRVKILDFGLVRAISPALSSEDEGGAPRDGDGAARPVLADRLTHTGGRVGTPGYMAPEQLAGGAADHRTDQYSFCVSLYQALCGELPASPGDVRDRTGRPRAPSGTLPGWLRKALLRGLAADPEARFPSMDDLLASIERAPGRARRRWTLAAATLLAAAGTLAALTLGPSGPSTDALLCQGAERKLAGIWDGASRAASRRAFESTGAVFAGDAWDRSAAILDRYTTAWTGAHREACEATHLRGEQSEELLDLQMACLDGRLQELRAVSGLFQRADEQIVLQATQVADGLSDVDACADRRRLTSAVAIPDDPAVADRVEAERARLAESRVQELAGLYKEALASAEQVRDAAASLEYPPLMAEALHQLALNLGRVGRLADMKDSLIRSARLGQASGHDLIVAKALTDLVVSGVLRGEPDEAHEWAELAFGAIARLQSERDISSRLRFFLGMLADLEKLYPEAIEHYRAALDLDPEITSRDRFPALNNLGVAYYRLGRVDDAIASYRAALEVAEASCGPRAPTLMGPLYNLGNLYTETGDFATAVPIFERALHISDEIGLPHMIEVTVNLKGLGQALIGLGRPREAIAPLERAIAIDSVRPQNQIYVAEAHFQLARALRLSGEDLGVARSRALTARGIFDSLGERGQEDLRQVEAWLHDAEAHL